MHCEAKNVWISFQDGKVNIPFPVKFMFQRRRIPNAWVTAGVKSKLPHFCGCRISPLRKDSQSKPHNLFLDVPSPAQVIVLAALPLLQERNKPWLWTVSVGQWGFVLILSVIHLSLPLHVPVLKAELYFSYTSAQCQFSQSCFQALWKF